MNLKFLRVLLSSVYRNARTSMRSMREDSTCGDNCAEHRTKRASGKRHNRRGYGPSFSAQAETAPNSMSNAQERATVDLEFEVQLSRKRVVVKNKKSRNIVFFWYPPDEASHPHGALESLGSKEHPDALITHARRKAYTMYNDATKATKAIVKDTPNEPNYKYFSEGHVIRVVDYMVYWYAEQNQLFPSGVWYLEDGEGITSILVTEFHRPDVPSEALKVACREAYEDTQTEKRRLKKESEVFVQLQVELENTRGKLQHADTQLKEQRGSPTQLELLKKQLDTKSRLHSADLDKLKEYVEENKRLRGEWLDAVEELKRLKEELEATNRLRATELESLNNCRESLTSTRDTLVGTKDKLRALEEDTAARSARDTSVLYAELRVKEAELDVARRELQVFHLTDGLRLANQRLSEALEQRTAALTESE
jgi:hypothetical protein